MRLIPNDVSTLAMGLAASMGQFLLSAGTPGKRYALPHSRVLMHQGSAGIGGTAVDIEIQAENLEHTKNVMMRLIAEHTGQPVEKVERDAAAGPLVHRRGGAGLRLRRPDPHRRLRRHARPRPGAAGGPAMSSYTIPSVVEKTVRGERAVDIYSRLLTDRIIYVGTEIDDGVANVVIAQLLHLESESPDVADQPLPQLARRLGHRDARGLRHDAVRLRAGRDDLRRPGGVVRRGAARRG